MHKAHLRTAAQPAGGGRKDTFMQCTQPPSVASYQNACISSSTASVRRPTIDRGPLVTVLQTSGTQGVDVWCFGIKGPAGRRAGDVEASRFFESDTGEWAGGVSCIATASWAERLRLVDATLS